MSKHRKSHGNADDGGQAPPPVRRRTILKALGTVPVLAFGAGDAVHSAKRGQVIVAGGPPALVAPVVLGIRYFVSPDGDDDGAGMHPMAPWRTIDGVNRRMDEGTLGSGDAVLFRAGATFYGKIRPSSLDLKTDPASRLLLSAYDFDGAHTRPVISSYKLLNMAGGWKSSGPNEWSIDLSRQAFGMTHSGYAGGQGGDDNIGFLRVDGVVHGQRVDSRSQLGKQWDFYCDGPVLYVRSSGNPAEATSDLRAACGETCIALADGLEVRGLRVEGGGGHGAQGTARSVRIVDNEFCELGGSLLAPGTRHGNGVEIWIGSSDVEVSRNVLHDIYDVALTMQGNRSTDDTGWSAVTFTQNLVYRCNQSIELWSEGSADRAVGFARCAVKGNICLFAGRGWSGTIRPDQNTKVHLLTYGWQLPADVGVTANVFHDAISGYRYSSEDTPGLTTGANLIRLRAGTSLSNRSPETIEAGSRWAARTATEPGSSFVVLTGDIVEDVGGALQQILRSESGVLDDSTRTLLGVYAARLAEA